jgi:hypothetical protein
MSVDPDAPAFLTRFRVGFGGYGDARGGEQQNGGKNFTHIYSIKRSASALLFAGKPDSANKSRNRNRGTTSVLASFLHCYLRRYFLADLAGFDAVFTGVSLAVTAFDLAAVFFAGLSAESVKAFGFAEVLAAALGFLSTESAAFGLAVFFAAGLPSAFFALSSLLGLAFRASSSAVFDFALAVLLAGGLLADGSSVLSISAVADLLSRSSNSRALCQYSSERPWGRPSASHRW